MNDDLSSRQAAIDYCEALMNAERLQQTDDWGYGRERYNQTECIMHHIENMPSAQPDVPDINVGDMISRQKVRYKLTALVNELEEIFSNIRERNEDDSVCGLCEYDGAYIGQSGDWCNECPGFDKSDCFKLKDKCRHEWEAIDE